MTLCENCLEMTNARPLPVGHATGQRDPIQAVRVLCTPCGDAVKDGHWDVLHARYTDTRQVSRRTG